MRALLIVFSAELYVIQPILYYSTHTINCEYFIAKNVLDSLAYVKILIKNAKIFAQSSLLFTLDINDNAVCRVVCLKFI